MKEGEKRPEALSPGININQNNKKPECVRPLQK